MDDVLVLRSSDHYGSVTGSVSNGRNGSAIGHLRSFVVIPVPTHRMPSLIPSVFAEVAAPRLLHGLALYPPSVPVVVWH